MSTGARLVRVDAAGACDGAGLDRAGGVSVLLEASDSAWTGRWPLGEITPAVVGRVRVVAVGSGSEIDLVPGVGTAERILRPGHVVMPAMVNPHTHLDLTHIGPLEGARGSFPRFVNEVRTRRAVDEASIAASVRLGVARSLAGGVVAVGDIAGAVLGRPSSIPFDSLRGLPMGGVSYLEFFAIGKPEAAAMERVGQVAESIAGRSDGRPHSVRPGLQPHAPYSVSSAAYRRAVEIAGRLSMPLATHLAESPAEREFVAGASGPQRELLEALGIWDEAILRDVAQGRTPVRHALAAGLCEAGRPVLAVHCNDMSDDDLRAWREGRGGATVVFCPRSAAYFGAAAHFGPHPVARIGELGIPWVVGTDSILNLDTPDRISPLDELRLIHRERLAPESATALLAKVTTEAAAALGLDGARYALHPGAEIAGLCAVPTAAWGRSAAEAVLKSDAAPELLVFGN